MLLEVVCAGEITNVSQELLRRQMGQWIFNAAMMETM